MWKAYVKDTWERSPKKIYKWIRGNASVWDLAILHDNGYALSSDDQTAQAELAAWSKLCIGELWLLPDIALEDVDCFLKEVEATGTWPQNIREMMHVSAAA
eukprot:3640459-Amphidinium_carterae.3